MAPRCAFRNVAQGEDDIPKFGVSPAGVFLGKAYHQVSDILRFWWATRSTLSAAVVLRAGILSEPTTQCVGGDQRTEVPQITSGKGFRLQCEATTLAIGESQALATKHLAQHFGFFSLVGDHRLLMSVDPAREHQHQKSPRKAPRFRLHGCHFISNDDRKRLRRRILKPLNSLEIAGDRFSEPYASPMPKFSFSAASGDEANASFPWTQKNRSLIMRW
jgi:hypothetical protein